MEKFYELFLSCSGVQTDTRTLTANCLFVCLSGERFNGNVFAREAIEKGARYVIADDQSVCDEQQIFYVPNTLTFLQALANHHRKQFDIPVIGITGSNGKTSSKELIAAVLRKKYQTLATTGNLNNHIGVPLTLLQLTADHEIAVIEMGANKFRDIAELCEMAEPSHGIITNIGKAHLEGFGGFEGVLKTKRELYESVEKSKGVIFYNSDDPVLCQALPSGTEQLSYGTGSAAFIQGQLISLTPFVCMQWKSPHYQSAVLETHMIGQYNFYNFLAAICIGSYFRVDPELISEAIVGYEPSNNRSQIKKTMANTLILDAYNANPTSMKSALESFALIDQKQKTAILGDMFELGESSTEEHALVLNLAKNLGLNCYFVGSRFYAQKGLCFDETYFYETKADLKLFLAAHPLQNQLILLKGSRGVGLEDLVENL